MGEKVVRANTRKSAGTSERKVAYHLYLRDVPAPVYEGETEAEALERARREIPAFRQRVRQIKESRASGASGTVPAEEVFARYGLDLPELPEATRSRRRGRPAATYNGKLLVRVPTSIHRELALRAEREKTTINQLVLTYLSRGLGADTARAG